MTVLHAIEFASAATAFDAKTIDLAVNDGRVPIIYLFFSLFPTRRRVRFIRRRNSSEVFPKFSTSWRDFSRYTVHIYDVKTFNSITIHIIMTRAEKIIVRIMCVDVSSLFLVEKSTTIIFTYDVPSSHHLQLCAKQKKYVYRVNNYCGSLYLSL